MIDDGHRMESMMGWLFDWSNGWIYLIIGSIVFLFILVGLIYVISHGEQGKNTNNDWISNEYQTDQEIVQPQTVTSSFCPSCGGKLEERHLKFCPFCGDLL